MRTRISLNNIFYVLSLLSISFLSSSFNIRYILVTCTFILCCLLVFTGHIKFKWIRGQASLLIPYLLIVWSGITLFMSGYLNTGWLRYVLLIYQTLITTLIAYYIPDLKRILYSYFVALIVLNLFFLIFMSDISIYNNNGEYVFRGMYYEKNTLGFNILLGIPLFVEIIKENYMKRQSIWPCIWLIISVLMIIISKSTTAFLFMFVLCGVALKNSKNLVKIHYFFPVIAGLFIGYLVNYQMIINSSINTFITNLIGKGLDFTGRSTLWFFSLELIQKKPLTGYGFNGFWSDNNRVYNIMNQSGYDMVGNHAHNGYIEILVSTGLVGLVLFFAMLIIIFKCMKNESIKRYILDIELIYIIFITFGNFIYNTLFDLGMPWCLLLIIYIRVIRIKKANSVSEL